MSQSICYLNIVDVLIYQHCWNSIWPQWLLSSSPHLSSDEATWGGSCLTACGCRLDQEVNPGFSVVCLPASPGCGWRCHVSAAVNTLTPSWYWGHCKTHIIWFLQCLWFHLASFTGWEAVADGDWLARCLLQGTVLSPFLFTLYTNDFQYQA